MTGSSLDSDFIYLVTDMIQQFGGMSGLIREFHRGRDAFFERRIHLVKPLRGSTDSRIDREFFPQPVSCLQDRHENAKGDEDSQSNGPQGKYPVEQHGYACKNENRGNDREDQAAPLEKIPLTSGRGELLPGRL